MFLQIEWFHREKTLHGHLDGQTRIQITIVHSYRYIVQCSAHGEDVQLADMYMHLSPK